MPYVFTEEGVAMLSGVLKSYRAVVVNIAIMRVFVFLRQYALSHKELTSKLKKLEKKYNKEFKDIREALKYLFTKDHIEKTQGNRRRIGFK